VQNAEHPPRSCPGRDVPATASCPSLTDAASAVAETPSAGAAGNNSTGDLEESSENRTNIVEDYPWAGAFLRIHKMLSVKDSYDNSYGQKIWGLVQVVRGQG